MAKKEKAPSTAMCAWPGIQSVLETMALTRAQAVHRALEAGEQVEDDAGHQELERHVVRSWCHWPFMVAKKL